MESGFPLLAPLLLEVALLLVRQLVVEGQADVQRVLGSLREPQGRGALNADRPERGLALLVGWQLRQLGLSGQAVLQELPLNPIVVVVAGALPVPLPSLLLGPVALSRLLPEAVEHLSSGLACPGSSARWPAGRSHTNSSGPCGSARHTAPGLSAAASTAAPAGAGSPARPRPRAPLRRPGNLRFRTPEKLGAFALRELQVQLHLKQGRHRLGSRCGVSTSGHVPRRPLNARALRRGVAQLWDPPVDGFRHAPQLVRVGLALLLQPAV